MSDPITPPEMLETLNNLHRKSQSLPYVEADAERSAGPVPKAHRPRMVVAIPSANRASVLPDTVRAIAHQDQLPDLVILSLSVLADIGDLAPDRLPFPVEIIVGKKGATAQRNRALDMLKPDDIVLFLDDDFLMGPDYIRQTQEIFDRNPTVAIATGTVFADGIHGPGFDHAKGAALLGEMAARPAQNTIDSILAGYGCNMAVRANIVIDHGIQFDEALPLYGWLEDVDFSRRIAAHGRVVKSGAMRGVHLGTKTGRSSGVFLGYSQIANPYYLFRKGTMTRRHAYKMMFRNAASNIFHSVKPPHWADFRGRLRGNILAAKDVLGGHATPWRILEFTP